MRNGLPPASKVFKSLAGARKFRTKAYKAGYKGKLGIVTPRGFDLSGR